jgi:predicted nucleic acid-binding protein
MRSVPPRTLHLSVLVVGEIRRGIERLRPSDPVQAFTIEGWLNELGEHFSARMLPVDRRVADTWGHMGAIRPIPVEDGLMAATALVHDMTFVTRNVGHVTGLGVTLLNPWADRPAAEH